MTRVFNFSAGPGTLPEEVLLRAADEMLDWHGSGQSVMEMSHRGKDYVSIAEAAEADLRTLLAVPDGYHVLFLQGGASPLQFEMIPMNLIQGQRAVADYIHTGEWAKKAINAAKGLADVNVAASAEESVVRICQAQSDWRRSDCRCGLPALHRQRDHWWRRIRRHTRCRGRARHQRHVLKFAFAPIGCPPTRPDLRRRTEEHRTRRTGLGDHPRRPHRDR